MAQNGYVFRQGSAWFIRYRHTVDVDGVLTVKQKCERLADYCDRYRSKKDVKDLVTEKMAKVMASERCPESAVMFTAYVEKTYLPFAKRNTKPSTYAGRVCYFEHYIKPRVEKYALRDFSTA